MLTSKNIERVRDALGRYLQKSVWKHQPNNDIQVCSKNSNCLFFDWSQLKLELVLLGNEDMQKSSMWKCFKLSSPSLSLNCVIPAGWSNKPRTRLSKREYFPGMGRCHGSKVKNKFKLSWSIKEASAICAELLERFCPLLGLKLTLTRSLNLRNNLFYANKQNGCLCSFHC